MFGIFSKLKPSNDGPKATLTVGGQEVSKTLTQTQTLPLAQPLYEKDPPWKASAKRFLKVKLKSLAAEAVIIRQEEAKAKGQLRNDLHAHRVLVVRSESRATLLAYNFIRGRTYEQTEGKCKTPAPKERVEAMVKKYAWGIADWKQNLQTWLTARSEG